jgi:hypothetical protein
MYQTVCCPTHNKSDITVSNSSLRPVVRVLETEKLLGSEDTCAWWGHFCIYLKIQSLQHISNGPGCSLSRSYPFMQILDLELPLNLSPIATSDLLAEILMSRVGTLTLRYSYLNICCF